MSLKINQCFRINLGGNLSSGGFIWLALSVTHDSNMLPKNVQWKVFLLRGTPYCFWSFYFSYVGDRIHTFTLDSCYGPLTRWPIECAYPYLSLHHSDACPLSLPYPPGLTHPLLYTITPLLYSINPIPYTPTLIPSVRVGVGGVQNLALMIRDRRKFFEWL